MKRAGTISREVIGVSTLAAILLNASAAAQGPVIKVQSDTPPNAINSLPAGELPGVLKIPPTHDTFVLAGGKVPGRWYDVVPGQIAAGAISGAPLPPVGNMLVYPMWTGAGGNVQSSAFNVTAANPAAWNVRVCLYDDSNGAPSALLTGGDSGAIPVAAAATGVQIDAFPSPITVSGWIWVGFEYDTAGASVSNVNPQSLSPLFGIDSAASFFTQWAAGLQVSMKFDVCPSIFPAGAVIRQGPAPFTPRLSLQF